MFKAILIATLPILAVVAQVEPSEPAPGDKFNEGSDCSISWAVDPTGTWTTLNIELMSGENTAMKHLTSKGSFSWPSVTTNG